jgi:hypothetical protein
VGPSEYGSEPDRTQEATRHFRQRRCLLKGCEQLFRPCCPQARYCSESCRQRARRWRRWRSSRTYRASEAGKQCRRQQSRRYRERRRVAARQAETPRETAANVIREAAQLDGLPLREGQRPASILTDLVGQPCLRPGCYVLFPIRPDMPQQRYCSCQCRQALRRVLDREARWRKRHHRQRRWRMGPPPAS